MSTRLLEVADRLLLELDRSAADPSWASGARTRLRELVAASGLELDLLLEPEPDLFLHDLAEGVSVILGVRRTGVAPWAAGDTLRWSESDFVRVDGTTLQVADVVALADLEWDHTPVLAKLVESCLLRAELAREEIPIRDDELQAGVDEFRQRRALLTASATEAWLEAQGIDMERLEALVIEGLRMAKLKARIVADRVVEETEHDLAAWDVVTVTEVLLAADDPVPAVNDAITLAARRAPSPRTKLFERRFRRDLPRELASQLSAPEGPTLVGPVARAHDRSLFLVWSIEPARADDATKIAMTNRLFDEWLADRRRGARIEWYEPPRQ